MNLLVLFFCKWLKLILAIYIALGGIKWEKIKTIVSHSLTFLHILNLKVFISLVGFNYSCVVVILLKVNIRKSSWLFSSDWWHRKCFLLICFYKLHSKSCFWKYPVIILANLVIEFNVSKYNLAICFGFEHRSHWITSLLEYPMWNVTPLVYVGYFLGFLT